MKSILAVLFIELIVIMAICDCNKIETHPASNSGLQSFESGSNDVVNQQNQIPYRMVGSKYFKIIKVQFICNMNLLLNKILLTIIL